MKTTKKMIAMLLTIAMIWTVAGVSFAEEVAQPTEQPVVAVEATQAPVVVVETPAEVPAEQPQATESAQPEEPAQQQEVIPETAAPAETVAVTEENTPEPTVESSVTEQPAATSEAATETPAITETPAVTETSAATETPAITETPAATETPAVDATTLPNVSIVIRCTNSKPITVGDTVKLTAEITGIDWHECTLQWQYLDGDEWKNASSGNDITYSYVLTDANLNTTWRLAVTIG